MRNLVQSMMLVGAVSAAGLLVHTGEAAAQEADKAGPETGPRQAEERRRNDLHTQPAVRHRKLLVAKRFEATPLFESTVNADFRHFVGVGLKLEYHLGDKLSVGALGVYAGAINTGLVDKIVPTLPDMAQVDSLEPSKGQFQAHLNKMPLHGAAYVSLTPWYGKLAAFDSAFVNFDFYFQAGVSFAQLQSDCPASICNDTAPGQPRPDPNNAGETLPPDFNPNNDPPLNSGGRVGAYLGAGIHVFLNDFLALDLTVRDYAFNDNPSGADYDANRFVNDDDSRFLNHLFMGVGLSVMLPMKAKRTR
ncbi:MAG TPA: outer membrane beta-barrel domain-containing protein [Kofleriaceae bacterium]|nr:outer membrane beta-barrel domain-containing protein [Kofleriaceae bacterium]